MKSIFGKAVHNQKQDNEKDNHFITAGCVMCIRERSDQSEHWQRL
jgi:hypothetical protein